jgi:8-oxo-dGTP diphosphatase
VTIQQGVDLARLRDEAARDGIAKLVVGAVVHFHGKVLILRRSPGDGFLPGIEELPSGGVEAGEDLIRALQRELAEEIGRTGPVTLDPGFVASFDYVSGSGRRARQLTFSIPHDGQPVILSEEHTGSRWIDPEGIGSSDVTRETAATIREWASRA